MKVTVLLADKGTANPLAGTLNLLNIGWTVTHVQPTSPVTLPQAVVVFFAADFAECNRPWSVELSLVDQDGHGVSLPGPAGPQPMVMKSQIVVAPPPGAPNGMPGLGNMMLELPAGLPIAPGAYKWQVLIDGDGRDDWCAQFYVTPAPVAPQFGQLPLPPA